MTVTERAETEGGSNPQNPLLRISVLGPFDIQWPQADKPFPEERLHGRGAAPALGLLKAILTRPNRFALRDWLLEQFWPHTPHSAACDRLEDLASKVRTILRPLESQAKILHLVSGHDGQGNGYRLEGYPLIWVDADAFEWYMQQAARLDRFQHPSLAFWEQAYQLGSRGVFLPEERYSDWAMPRRRRLQGHYRQCVHRVVHLLRKEGAGDLALLRLRTYWQQHPTDEDMLRPLLEMLGERECYNEAEEYYAQAHEALRQDSREFNDKTKDVMQFLRAKPIVRERAIEQVRAVAQQLSPQSQSQKGPSHERLPDFPQSIPQDTIEVSVDEPEVQSANRLPATDRDSMQQPTPAGTHQELWYHSLSTEDVLLLLSLERGDDIMTFEPSKRDTLRRIVTALLAATRSAGMGAFAISDPEPWERLSKAQQASSPSTMLNEATLEYFRQLLTISWQLCDEGQLTSAEGTLMIFLPQLRSLSKQEPSTASLASQGLRLQSIFAGHHLRLSDKVRLCEQGVTYARQAKNTNILAAALRELVWAYKYSGQPDSLQKRLITHQELLTLSRQVSPLVQSSIYSDYSIALAESGRIREAEFYIELAQEALPDDPAKDPAFAIDGSSSMFNLSYCAGFVCIHAGSIPQAFNAFERYKQHPSGLVIPERMRLEIANGQSRAAILDNDAERFAGLLEDVLVGSVRIESKKRFDEALHIFREEMPASWLSVQRIKELAEQYGLRRME